MKKSTKIELITNQMSWTANTIGDLYKARWDIEIFFRDIKLLLHIKSFIGKSQNAVMIQIWTAPITILVLKALKAMPKHNWYLSNLAAFIRLNLFVNVDLQKWLNKPFDDHSPPIKNNVYGLILKTGKRYTKSLQKTVNLSCIKNRLGQDCFYYLLNLRRQNTLSFTPFKEGSHHFFISIKNYTN